MMPPTLSPKLGYTSAERGRDWQQHAALNPEPTVSEARRQEMQQQNAPHHRLLDACPHMSPNPTGFLQTPAAMQQDGRAKDTCPPSE